MLIDFSSVMSMLQSSSNIKQVEFQLFSSSTEDNSVNIQLFWAVLSQYVGCCVVSYWPKYLEILTMLKNAWMKHILIVFL